MVEALNKDSGVKRLGKTENELTKVIGARIDGPQREKPRSLTVQILTLTVLTRPRKPDRKLRRYVIQV